MVTPLASRFAVLPVDDDGDTSRRITAKSLKKKENQPKAESFTLVTTKKSDNKKKQNAKKKTDPPATASKSKSKSKSEGNKKKSQEQQWEQWKQKDAELVDGTYAEDLQQAMLLSKLDYEENKEHYEQLKKTAEEDKKAAAVAGGKKVKKSNKAQPMSLSQFNQIGENDNQADSYDHMGGGDSAAALTNGKPEADPEFFDRVKTEAKRALQTEQAEEQRKAREPHIDELISVAQYQDRLEKCQEEMARLREDNDKLKEDLNQVKTRNKKLCQLLLHGEMKDKAQVLVEVDKLQRVRDELSNEVESLAAQLEQEKSKVRALTGGDTKAKEKNKKRTESK